MTTIDCIVRLKGLEEVNKAYSLGVEVHRCYEAFLYGQTQHNPNLPKEINEEFAYRQVEQTINCKMKLKYGGK